MEFKQQQAIYLQIADLVCEKILRRERRAKEKIPSVREMAITIEVNPNTVIRAYGYLEEKRIIYKQRGIGYFVAKNAYENTLKLKKDIFLQRELPAFFKTIKLLKMGFKDIEQLYKKVNDDENQQ